MIAERLLNQNSLIVIAIECIIVLLLLIMALIRHRKIVAGLSQLGIEEAVSRESSVWLRNALIFLILATIEIFLELFFIVPISMLAALIISILVLWITAMWILYEELMPYFVRFLYCFLACAAQWKQKGGKKPPGPPPPPPPPPPLGTCVISAVKRPSPMPPAKYIMDIDLWVDAETKTTGCVVELDAIRTLPSGKVKELNRLVYPSSGSAPKIQVHYKAYISKTDVPNGDAVGISFDFVCHGPGGVQGNLTVTQVYIAYYL